MRKGWPFARKHESFKVMDKGGLVISTRPITSMGVAVLVMLGGAMVIDERLSLVTS